MTTPACVIAWLLCAVLVCLAVHSPHCDLCDGPFTVDLFFAATSCQPAAARYAGAPVTASAGAVAFTDFRM